MQIFLRQQLVPLPYLQFVPNSKHHFSRMSDLKIDATSGSDHSLKPEICSSEDIDVLAVASGEDFILEETDAFYVFKSGHIFTHWTWFLLNYLSGDVSEVEPDPVISTPNYSNRIFWVNLYSFKGTFFKQK